MGDHYEENARCQEQEYQAWLSQQQASNDDVTDGTYSSSPSGGRAYTASGSSFSETYLGGPWELIPFRAQLSTIWHHEHMGVGWKILFIPILFLFGQLANAIKLCFVLAVWLTILAAFVFVLVLLYRYFF